MTTHHEKPYRLWPLALLCAMSYVYCLVLQIQIFYLKDDARNQIHPVITTGPNPRKLEQIYERIGTLEMHDQQLMGNVQELQNRVGKLETRADGWIKAIGELEQHKRNLYELNQLLNKITLKKDEFAKFEKRLRYVENLAEAVRAVIDANDSKAVKDYLVDAVKKEPKP